MRACAALSITYQGEREAEFSVIAKGYVNFEMMNGARLAQDNF